jgi:ApaG protein
MYADMTRNIRISVEPTFLDDQSAPDENLFVWAYHISIENEGNECVQLKSRYWHITDSLGRVQEVRGRGVVGEQPMLNPGEIFEYTSGVHLTAGSGIMAGNYEMEDARGEMFEVSIPAFSLDSPHEYRLLQ